MSAGKGYPHLVHLGFEIQSNSFQQALHICPWLDTGAPHAAQRGGNKKSKNAFSIFGL
jgi:hypothetical protein